MKRLLTVTSRLTKAVAGAAAVALCGGGGGCLINSANEKVVEPDAKRVAVDFESEESLATFQHAAAARYAAGGGVVGTSGFAIPFVIAAGEKRVLSENAFYNTQVRKADANGDGVVSNSEARVYAQ